VLSLSNLKLLCAFLAGMATLAIGYATYSDVHRADISAVTEQQRHDAEEVSFAQAGKHDFLAATVIANNSNAPVHFVVIDVDVAVFNHIPSTAPTIRTFAFSLYDIPACSVGTTNITDTALKEMLKLMEPHHFRYLVMNVGPLSFTDRNGVSWKYSTIGKLVRGPGLPEPSGRTTHISVPFKASTGCS